MNGYQLPALQTAFAANPQATPGFVAQPAPTHRIGLAGGLVGATISPEGVMPVENLWRTLPIPGVFTATSAKPTTIELGAFVVPREQVFIVLDYRFDIYRPSGIAVGDFMPFEPRRLSTQIGWSITSSGKPQGNWSFQLTPSLPAKNASTLEFAPPPNPGIIPGQTPFPSIDSAIINRVRAENQGPTLGLAVMPQRHHREGLLEQPYSWALRPQQVLAVKAVVFNPVPVPVAFFEASVTGWLLPLIQAEEFLKQQQLPLAGTYK